MSKPTKYVRLDHVQELLKLIGTRDSFNDWTYEYDKANKKVSNTVAFIERNAKYFTPVPESDQLVTDLDKLKALHRGFKYELSHVQYSYSQNVLLQHPYKEHEVRALNLLAKQESLIQYLLYGTSRREEE